MLLETLHCYLVYEVRSARTKQDVDIVGFLVRYCSWLKVLGLTV